MEETTKKYQHLDYYPVADRVYISGATYVHARTNYEMHYLLSGEEQYFMHNRYYNIKEGDVVLVPAGVFHKRIENEKVKYAVVTFTDFFLSKFLTKRSIELLAPLFKQKIFHPTRETSQLLLSLFRDVEAAQKKNNENQIFSLLLRIFILLMDAPIAPATENLNKRALIDAIVDYVHTHYNSLIGLDDVADALFVSKYYVCRTFTKYMGVSFNEYLTQLRLKKAEQLIVLSQKNINEIAKLSGFNTSTYFCQVFKKYYKVSPLIYRKRNT